MLATVELGVWIVAASTLLAAIIGATGAVIAALIAHENRRKLRARARSVSRSRA